MGLCESKEGMGLCESKEGMGLCESKEGATPAPVRRLALVRNEYGGGDERYLGQG